MELQSGFLLLYYYVFGVQIFDRYAGLHYNYSINHIQKGKEYNMKLKVIIFSLISVFLLAACGQKTLSEPITLLDQNQQKVTFPLEKPTVFFFITSYT